LAGELEAFRDGQRDLLLRIVQRFWLHGMVDCSELIGRENISAFILRVTSKRSRVRQDAALTRPQRN